MYGNTYDTADGTGVRDYIHIMDVAEGHLAAVRHILRPDCSGTRVFNLGTGGGHSVLEVVQAFEQVNSGKRGQKSATWEDRNRNTAKMTSKRLYKDTGCPTKTF